MTRGPYFVGKPASRHITIKTAVDRINELIRDGVTEVPVWVGGIYGDPLLTIAFPMSVLELAHMIKMARKESKQA